MSDEYVVVDTQLMISRVFLAYPGLVRPIDESLLRELMRTAVKKGFRSGELENFQVGGSKGYGFFRDREHYAGVCQVQRSFGLQIALMVRSTGRYEGEWSFMADPDGAILTSHDSQPCEAFDDLEGLDLVGAVILSALTEMVVARPKLMPRLPSRRWRFPGH